MIGEIFLHFHAQLVHLTAHNVQILKPGLHGDEYICRKGLATVNIQATCDASERFTIVSANWPGFVHDSNDQWLMTNFGTDALLLGDEGYDIAP